jgi:hypothetical protein
MSRACAIDWRQAIRQQAIRQSDEFFVSVLHHKAHVIREPFCSRRPREIRLRLVNVKSNNESKLQQPVRILVRILV